MSYNGYTMPHSALEVAATLFTRSSSNTTPNENTSEASLTTPVSK
eukprot:CAMPEP_0169389152 /NCGR_PEP_ID=MMETSP1017-20121227/46543_1 /TAXON_ID=342587 /ORGANISM="Karlodinium micrum, Strain CCMP2283" /LENGTH=44 /DNA_ID= /DNA_START= /DNA_END= /DNA_ORIENTATION=